MEDGKQFECELKNGIRHGKVKTFEDNVLTEVAEYVDGVKQGEVTCYWDNGRVRSISTIADGKETEVAAFSKFDRPTLASGCCARCWRMSVTTNIGD